MSPELESILDGFNELEREFFEERAAIFEFDAGCDRASAEKQAVIATVEFFNK